MSREDSVKLGIDELHNADEAAARKLWKVRAAENRGESARPVPSPLRVS